MTDPMVRPVTVNFPTPLYERMEGVREEVQESSTEDFILKMVTGSLILIEQELAKRRLVQSPTVLTADGQTYRGTRTPVR